MEEKLQYLTIEDVHRELSSLGFRFSLAKVRRMATEGVIPFVSIPKTHRLYIRRDALMQWVRSLQPDAKLSRLAPAGARDKAQRKMG